MKARGLHLINGTCPDLNGQWTFQSKRGSSTVDYVWVDEGFLLQAQRLGLPVEMLLQVGSVEQKLSDHAPLGLIIASDLGRGNSYGAGGSCAERRLLLGPQEDGGLVWDTTSD